MASMYNYPSTYNYGRYEKSCPYRSSECTRTECPDGYRNREEFYNRPVEHTNWNREAWYPENRFYNRNWEMTPNNWNRFNYESCPVNNTRDFNNWMNWMERFGGRNWDMTRYLNEHCPWFFNNNNMNNRNMTPFNNRNWMNRFFNNDWFKTFEHELDSFRNFFDKWNKEESKDYTTALAQIPSRPASNLEYYTFMNPVKVDNNGNRWLYICFDLRSFKSEEVRVTLYTKDKYIEVEANHHVKDSKEHDVKRSYCRKYYFPSDLYCGDATKLELKSYMTNEGYLYCEAKLPQLKPEEAAKARPHMPVNVCPIKTEVKDM